LQSIKHASACEIIINKGYKERLRKPGEECYQCTQTLDSESRKDMVSRERIRGTGPKLKYRKFHSNKGRHFFP